MKNLIEDRRGRTRTQTKLIRLLLLIVILFAGVIAAQAQWTTDTSTNNIYYNAGNVGIGTTSPAQKLDVAGNMNVGTSGAGSRINGLGPQANSGLWLQYTDGNSYYDSAQDMQLRVNGNSSVATAMTLKTSGNIGIGTTSPQYKLSLGASSDKLGFYSDATHFNSLEFYNSSDGGMYFDQNTAAGGGYHWKVATSEKLTLTYAGNVGIGTTGPYWKLTVNDPTVGYNSDAGNIAISNSSDTTKRLLFGIDTNLGTNGSGFIQSVKSGTGVTPLLLNANGGNVGIGTTNPGYKLDVNGTINSNSTITANNIVAKYQDVAEWVPASEQLCAGTVVVLDSTKSNQVTSSSVSYDTRVAGVVSEQPGIALGEKSENKVLVATTGRVRVKVDASKGPIHIGDLLVTSDIPGVAMKSEPVEFAGRKMHMPGTLIGKALEPLEKGQGEILALLSLQ